MQTIEILRNAWPQTLREFTAIHEGWLVSLDVLGPEIGAQPEIANLPLLDVSADHVGDVGRITISAGRTIADHITHVVDSPTRLYVERTDNGADLALGIESADGTKSILRFRATALPETVDGIVRR
jgi:uncharacterized protein DUF5335